MWALPTRVPSLGQALALHLHLVKFFCSGKKHSPEFSLLKWEAATLGSNLPSGALPANRDRCFGTGNLGCVGGHRAGWLVSDPKVRQGGS